MKAYRLSINLKLGLVLSAVVIALASLFYTHRLADRLRAREQFFIQVWARAQEQIAQSSAEGGEVTLATEIITQGGFGIPSVIVDSLDGPVFARNVPVEVPTDDPAVRARAERLVADMAETFAPIPIVLDGGPLGRTQYLYYDESRLIKELRVFPYVQLLLISLFVLAGYLGFSYVRRSEQGSLWVGMAKEAAHQLGTPISSLMGWHELLSTPGLDAATHQTALDEIENDIVRLRRVTSRFSDIGSLPKLSIQPLAPVVERTADYLRRRLPQHGKDVALTAEVPAGLHAPLNAELFEWVVENLLKNALDAIETDTGEIAISATREGERILIDVRDTGKGIDRRQWKNIFRPGYSTKKRGWGLGLSLAKRIVEDYHGGQLTLAQSRPGQGTTFRIELPSAP